MSARTPRVLGEYSDIEREGCCMIRFFKRGVHYLLNDSTTFFIILLDHCSFLFPDRLYLRLQFRLNMGYWPNLEQPRTFSEKLQWLKLHNRKPVFTTMADKIAVKQFVAKRIGSEYIIPTIAIYDSAEDVDFNKLPPKFVLKCNHNSGLGMFICQDKSKLNTTCIRRELSKGLQQNYFLHAREWPYKHIPRKILAEEYIDGGSKGLNDYKIHCFNGVPMLIEVDFNRFIDHHRNLYDTDWHLLDMEMNYPSDRTYVIERPKHIDIMLKIAAKLSIGIPYLRVDLYNVDGKIYFGELTFYHQAGFVHFKPKSFDAELGAKIILTQNE